MSSALRIGATGFGLMAVRNGFARFAFGLFLPQIDGDLSLGTSLSGVISGGFFAGYCVAFVASADLTDRPRHHRQWRLAFGAFPAVALLLAIAAAISLSVSGGGSRAGGLPPMTGV